MQSSSLILALSFVVIAIIATRLVWNRKNAALIFSITQFIGGSYLLFTFFEDWVRGLFVACALWLLAGSVEEFTYWQRNRKRKTKTKANKNSANKQ